MYIIVVEDDQTQRKFIINTISKEFSIEPEEIVTELEFRNSFEDIASNQPDLMIFDTMIRWTDPVPNMEKPPQEILEAGFYRAGIRCIKMLNDDDRTKNIPVIIYSVLDYEDIEKEIKELPKAKYLFKDFNEKNLVNKIKSLT